MKNWTVKTLDGYIYYAGTNGHEAKVTYMRAAINARTNFGPAPHIYRNGNEQRIIATVSRLTALEQAR